MSLATAPLAVNGLFWGELYLLYNKSIYSNCYRPLLQSLRANKEWVMVATIANPALGPPNWIRNSQENQGGYIEFSKFDPKKVADQEGPEPQPE